MTRLSASEARQDFAEVLNRVAYEKERIVLHRRGKNVAVVVPVEDLELIEELEDEIDNAEADQVLMDMEAKGERPVPLEAIKQRLGLE